MRHFLEGALCGFLNGFFGSGGGVIAVPVLKKELSEPSRSRDGSRLTEPTPAAEPLPSRSAPLPSLSAGSLTPSELTASRSASPSAASSANSVSPACSGGIEGAAHATSVGLIFVISLATTAFYLLSGGVDFAAAWSYIPWGIAGSVAGALLLKRIKAPWLRRIFGVIVVAAAVRSLFFR